MNIAWTCRCCGKQYDTLSFAYALDEPDPWHAMSATEQLRGVRGTDTCMIDDKQFFIRGRVLLPVIGESEPFIWGCWASVSQESFQRFGKLWDAEHREHEPPFPGALANDIPIYPATFGLQCQIVLKNARRHPSFELEATGHPLAIEQRNGITLDRVKEIAATVLRHSV